MTTTIRLDKELRARIASAAERQGKSMHAFMVDALARTVELSESEAAFHRLSLERQAEMERTGRFIAWDDMKNWLTAKAAGKSAKKPVVRKRSR